MKKKNKIRRLVLRINPDYEEHVKLETQIKNMCKTMGFTNTQAVIMMLRGFTVNDKDEDSISQERSLEIETKNEETLRKLDDFLENDHKSIMEQTDGFLDTFSDL